ncbi:MAG: response regulator [Micavibrio aeruginosavorus]|uniref:Response regulator n=1 Tax=Micavibrio aeruginosavorus TaxID=349221 RepID=A0A7T5UIW9_9BACT|nr:MAG: response regulator [Micavibrio aeruginosavorus]
MVYQFKTVSILVVDDMKPMVSLVSGLLKVFGFSAIYTADNPEDAFAQFCRYKPDIVLTDWQMQPFDGLELIRMIRRDPRSPNKFVPVIMMSGYSHRIRVEQARDVGVTEFLVKPFTAKDLFARIEQLIERPRQFVDSGQFFGPDRRRRKGEYAGQRRREDDVVDIPDMELDMIDPSETERILKDLQEHVRNVGPNLHEKK